MRLTGLADTLRKWGLTVVEDPGWQHRGLDFPSHPHVVVAHHTGTPQSAAGDYPSLHVVRDGRSDLPGPLCQVGIGRSGKVYVIAAGKANHAGKGAWRGHDVGNSDSVGIEAESPGDGHWTTEQRRVYPIVCAALHDLLGTGADLTCGHRESALPAGRKVDPVGIDLEQLRRDTAAYLKAGPPKPAVHAQATASPTPLGAKMLFLLSYNGRHYITDGFQKRLVTPSFEKALVAAGVKYLTLSAADAEALPGSA